MLTLKLSPKSNEILRKLNNRSSIEFYGII
jgi:hypothetical protein